MKTIISILIFFVCSYGYSQDYVVQFKESINSENKVGIQFFLDVKYPDLYEKAYQEYRNNLSSILNGAEMHIAKIDGLILENINYINIVTAKNKEHLNNLLNNVSKSEYHQNYHKKIRLDKGDVRVVSVKISSYI